MKKTFALIGLIAIFQGLCHGADKQTVDSSAEINIAVLDLEPRGGLTAEEILALSDRLRGELLETGKYTVLERSQMSRILEEQGFQQSGVCSDASCMVEMGQLLAVQLMVSGSIGKMGKAYAVSIKIINVESGKIEKQISDDVKCTKEELISFHMKNFARRMAGLDTKKKSLLRRWYFWMPIALIGVGGAAYGGVTLADRLNESEEEKFNEVDITIPVTE